MDQIGIWTAVALSGGLVCEKVMLRFNLYDGVRHLHFNCSRCCDFDVQRSESMVGQKPLPLPSRGNSRGGSEGGNPPLPGALTPIVERAEAYMTPPRIEELMRRVSIALVAPTPTELARAPAEPGPTEGSEIAK